MANLRDMMQIIIEVNIFLRFPKIDAGSLVSGYVPQYRKINQPFEEEA